MCVFYIYNIIHQNIICYNYMPKTISNCSVGYIVYKYLHTYIHEDHKYIYYNIGRLNNF